MRLEITLCHSILDFCLSNADPWQRNNDANDIRDEIMRRRVVVNPEIEEYWSRYFEEEKPELLPFFQSFLDSTVPFEENCLLLDVYLVSDKIDHLFETDDVKKRLLYNVCFTSKDKILFTTLMDSLINSSDSEINVYNVQRIVDKTEDNLLNNYRLPITNKVIRPGESNFDLSLWLKRFWDDETSLIICDNYAYQNKDSLHNYLLTYIQPGSTIKLYTTTTPRINRSDIVNVFSKPPFNKWDFQIYMINHKQDQHWRVIYTSHYQISLDKGFGTFRSNGRTDQSAVNVSYHNNDIYLPNSRRIL